MDKSIAFHCQIFFLLFCLLFGHLLFFAPLELTKALRHRIVFDLHTVRVLIEITKGEIHPVGRVLVHMISKTIVWLWRALIPIMRTNFIEDLKLSTVDECLRFNNFLNFDLLLSRPLLRDRWPHWYDLKQLFGLAIVYLLIYGVVILRRLRCLLSRNVIQDRSLSKALILDLFTIILIRLFAIEK